jgi:hypothetical protein
VFATCLPELVVVSLLYFIDLDYLGVMFQIRSLLLMLILPTLTYGSQRLYWWVPLVNQGGLYHASSTPISGTWGAGWAGMNWRASPKIGITASAYEFWDYEKNDQKFSDPFVYDVVCKGNFVTGHLLSKAIHGYVQVGVWGANATLALAKPKALKGSGCVLGAGGYWDLSSLVFVDFSWKKLIALPIFSAQNMTHTGIFTLGLGVRLW